MSVRFNENHLPVLEALGIVPWISQQAANEAVPMPGQQSHPDEQGQSPAAKLTASPGVLPLGLEELAHWLPGQLLSPFNNRGAVQFVTGSHSARVLVVVEPASTAQDSAPLSGDALRLFELMMRSISLTRNDVGIAALAMTADVENLSSLSDVCSDNTRAILLFQQQWGLEEPAADQHGCRLNLRQLPLWRLPHPDLLMQNAQLKRVAWEVLKAVQAVLPGR